MARTTTVIESPAQPVAVESGERISWGAILGGAVTALAVGALLYALGFALGLSALNPDNPASFRASSIFTGIWSLVTSFVALFVGGMVASRVAGSITRTGGAIHGLVMWGLTTIGGALVIFNLLTQAISGAAAIGKTTLEVGASAAAGAANQAGGVANALGVNFDDLLAPINERLTAEGKPPVTAAQVDAASKDIVQDALHQGRLDREILVSSISEQTNLSRTDAEDIATRIETAIGTARAHASGAASSLQTRAMHAAESSGKAFWGVFGALFVGMISAVLGAMLGASKQRRIQPPRRGTPPGELTDYGDAFPAGTARTYP